MLRLKNRQRQIPGGLNFFDPSTRYTPPRYASFDTIVSGVIAARRANPAATKQFNLPTDYDSVANEVDLHAATFCHQKGYLDYIEGTPEGAGAQAARPPFQPPANRPIHGNVRPPISRPNPSRVVAGAVASLDWLASGAEAVPTELAEIRASICASCPLNTKGDWTSFFTVPVSSAIRGALNALRAWHLNTTKDSELGVCDACSCPLRLKVWFPIEKIMSKIPQASKDALTPQCWIRSEGMK